MARLGSAPLLVRQQLRGILSLAFAVIFGLSALVFDVDNAIDGFLYDLKVRIAALFGAGSKTDETNTVAIIALDRKSLASPELSHLPRAFLAKKWAKMIEASLAAGAKAIGFDIVFAYSANAFSPNFDQPLLAAIGLNSDKIVLGRSAYTPIVEQFHFILDERSIGFVELELSSDGIYRTGLRDLTVQIGSQGESAQQAPTLAAQLLARSGGPEMLARFMIAPRDHLEKMPTYSLVDILRCADSDPQALERALAGRILLVGTTLPDEDRKATPARFFSPPHVEGRGATHAGCELAPLDASDPDSVTVPGVHVQAEIVRSVLQGHTVQPIGRGWLALLCAAIAFASSWTASRWSPGRVFATVLIATLLLFAIAVWLLDQNIWLPSALVGGALILPLGPIYVSRYLFEDRRRRRIQKAFGHFLAPAIVDRLSESDTALSLGGEIRNVSVMFADLSGFTAKASRMEPEALMDLTNRYLGILVGAVESTGGYVDKFIGDAVMAFWGAPADDERHAYNAVLAAMRALAAVNAEAAKGAAKGEESFSVKIAVNSGPALVGHVGSERRYNYTAVGDAVNVAARLESLPNEYHCGIVVGEETARLTDDDFLYCELDWIRVKGREKALSVYEPLAGRSAAIAEMIGYQRGYAEALSLYRQGQFATAIECWQALYYPAIAADQSRDRSPPKVMARRAAQYVAGPAPEAWDGVYTKVDK